MPETRSVLSDATSSCGEHVAWRKPFIVLHPMLDIRRVTATVYNQRKKDEALRISFRIRVQLGIQRGIDPVSTGPSFHSTFVKIRETYTSVDSRLINRRFVGSGIYARFRNDFAGLRGHSLGLKLEFTGSFWVSRC